MDVCPIQKGVSRCHMLTPERGLIFFLRNKSVPFFDKGAGIRFYPSRPT